MHPADRAAVKTGRGLDGLAVQELAPGGEEAHLVGPYEELLAVLQRDQAALASGSQDAAERVVPAPQGGSPADRA